MMSGCRPTAERGSAMAPETTLRIYGSFYLPAAVATVVLTFFPYYEDKFIVIGDRSFRATHYLSLGEILDHWGAAGAPLLWLLLAATALALLVCAALRPRSVAVAVWLAVVAGLLVANFALKLGTGSNSPGYSPAGLIALVLGACTVVVAIIHAVHA